MSFPENSSISTVSAWKYKGQGLRLKPERLATETLLTLSINGLPAYQMLYLPGQEIELCLGFLLTSGVIETAADIKEMRLAPIDAAAGRAFVQVQIRLTKTFHNKMDLSAALAEAVLSGAEAAGQPLAAEQFRKLPGEPMQATVAEIISLMATLPERQEIYRATGATHAIFLATPGGEVLLGAEDVGRHNAFDKVVGQALMKNLATADKIALLSGRASFEMVFKAARAGIPMIASVSAPTSLAVQLAEAQGITLIGFVRGERLNIYTQVHRIVKTGSPGA